MAKKRSIIQIAGLLLFIVIIPFISYIWLKNGFDYRVELLNELGEYGKLPELSNISPTGDTLRADFANKNVVLFAPLDLNQTEQRSTIGKYYGELLEQFDAVERIVFVANVNNSTADRLQDFQAEFKLQDTSQVFFVKDRPMQVESFDFIEKDITGKPIVFLADTLGTIRNYYNLENGPEFVRLVEHISILMPRVKRAPALINPEKEL